MPKYALLSDILYIIHFLFSYQLLCGTQKVLLDSCFGAYIYIRSFVHNIQVRRRVPIHETRTAARALGPRGRNALKFRTTARISVELPLPRLGLAPRSNARKRFLCVCVCVCVCLKNPLTTAQNVKSLAIYTTAQRTQSSASHNRRTANDGGRRRRMMVGIWCVCTFFLCCCCMALWYVRGNDRFVLRSRAYNQCFFYAAHHAHTHYKCV